jgi:hypothetical protein
MQSTPQHNINTEDETTSGHFQILNAKQPPEQHQRYIRQKINNDNNTNNTRTSNQLTMAH